MLSIRRKAHARAGLVGNPSDGYGGKTISLSLGNYCAEVVLYEWEEIELLLSQDDKSRFSSVRELARDVELHGYYGGIRLVKATIKKFVQYCDRRQLELHDRNFSVRYESNIPRQVGLAGSSAIIVATLRALMEFYGVEIPLRVQPSLVLSVETDELGISAGLQDRVIQVYGGLVFMDFSPSCMIKIDGLDCGTYEPLDPALLPPLYVAYSTDVSQPTEQFHNRLSARFQAGEADMLAAMNTFAELTLQARSALLEGDADRLAQSIDANFDTRRSICRLPHRHVEMVETARRAGASAKFAGSGGAIVGAYRDEAMLAELRRRLGEIDCHLVKPIVAAGA